MEVVPNMDNPVTLYCDNSNVVANAREPHSHKRVKHIESKYHLIREIINRGDIIVTKIPTLDNLADPFTKILLEKLFFKHIEEMGLKKIHHL